jgi:hypothetical protein
MALSTGTIFTLSYIINDCSRHLELKAPIHDTSGPMHLERAEVRGVPRNGMTERSQAKGLCQGTTAPPRSIVYAISGITM